MAFANAMHGMPKTPKYPPRKDSYFRMKAVKSAKPQSKYKSKQKCAPVHMPPKPRPEYSNPQFRKNYAYKPQGLNGKAGEVLGVTNKRIYANNKNKPLPKLPKQAAKKAPKMKKPVVYNATRPLPKLPKGARKPKKKSTGCVVM